MSNRELIRQFSILAEIYKMDLEQKICESITKGMPILLRIKSLIWIPYSEEPEMSGDSSVGYKKAIVLPCFFAEIRLQWRKIPFKGGFAMVTEPMLS